VRHVFSDAEIHVHVVGGERGGVVVDEVDALL
jgi:hypothetical protein